MKVKLKIGMANAQGCFKRGAVIDVASDTAKLLVQDGYAEHVVSLVDVVEEPVKEEPAVVQVADANPVEEQAVAPVVEEIETAANPSSGKKKQNAKAE